MAKARFPNVNKIKSRDGRFYYYHRKTGARLPDDFGSPDFAVAWAQEQAKTNAPRTVAGPRRESYQGLVHAFERSPEWGALADTTRRDYATVVRWMLEVGAGELDPRLRLQEGAENIVEAAHAKGYRFARYVVQFNRRLHNWVLERSERQRVWGDQNPWTSVPLPKRPKGLGKRHREWTPAEIATALSHADLGMARAVILAASGCAGGDIVARTWDEYDGEGFEPLDRSKSGVTGYPTVPALLRPWLDNGPRPCRHVATNAAGRPWKSAGSLQTCAGKFLRGLATDGRAESGLTLHGLRHTLGKALADSGADLRAIQGALQHATARMALHYSEGADKKRRTREAVSSLDDWFGDDLQNIVPIDCKTRRAGSKNG